jgi:hypothetical protein
MSTPLYPVRLVGGGDLGWSRLTVFFRIILAIPHLVWATLYGVATLIAVVIAWFAALFSGRVPEGLHSFIAGYLTYWARVVAYVALLADPFPPFGAGGSYPVDLEIDPPVAQGRLGVFFRYLLAIPCMFVAGILQYLMYLVAIGCWFVALFTGSVPGGLANVGMFCLRFQSRTHAYVMLVNPRYPSFSGDEQGSLASDAASLPPLP